MMTNNQIIEKLMGKLKSIYYNLKIKRLQYINIGLGLNKAARESNIIVSLTTYGVRLETVHICIKSILNQSMRPDKIILYLGTDVNIEDIPFEVLRLKKYGVVIIDGCDDIKPHKKYYYAMKNYPNDIIVTIDDDVIYEYNTIKKLYESHLNYPKAVICTRGVFITRDMKKNLQPYSCWNTVKNTSKQPSMSIMPTGVGGVLYPPYILNRQIFDKNLIKQLSLEADDIWLKMMGVLNNTPVYMVRLKSLHPWPIPNTEQTALTRTNVGENKNDLFLKNVEEYFNVGIDGEKIGK